MCVGNGYVVEAVNDVFNVYSATTGGSVLADNTATNIVGGFPRNVDHAVDLNSFYGYAPAIDRSTGVRGQFVTDPSCIFDAQTQRFFVVVLTLDPQVPGPCQGVFSCVNHLDLAVSQTNDPTGSWNIYRIDVTNDGTNTGSVNPGPYLGDYPHIGADANGIYLTTNAYPWHTNGFSGAQIYALSKAQLSAGAANVTMQHIDTSGSVNAASEAGSTQPGFTLWPAQSPGTSQFNLANNGTEYFLSSNAADEARNPVSGSAGSRTSSQLIVWTLTNTQSLNAASGAVSLSNKILSVGQYGVPPKQQQPGSGTAPTTTVPQGYCLNDETTLLFTGQSGCWKLLVGAAAHAAGTEVVARSDSNDTRMQQVTYANGKLWGALDTALNPGGGSQRAGIAWYVVNPSTPKVVLSGYLGASGHDFTYPAIGVTASGRGVMAFTDTADDVPERCIRADRRERRRRRLERRHRWPRRRRRRRVLRLQAAELPEPDPLALGRLRRSGGQRQLGLDRQRVRRPHLRLRPLGRPVLRGRHRRQPARHLRGSEPRPRPADRARELVNTDQQAHPLTDR